MIVNYLDATPLPHLTAGFASANPAVITNVLDTLQRMAGRSVPAREALAAALSHPSPAVRAAASGTRIHEPE